MAVEIVSSCFFVDYDVSVFTRVEFGQVGLDECGLTAKLRSEGEAFFELRTEKGSVDLKVTKVHLRFVIEVFDHETRKPGDVWSAQASQETIPRSVDLKGRNRD